MVKPVFQFRLPKEAKAIREEVFVKEQGFANEFDEIDDRSWHLVLYLDQTPIATGRVYEVDPETYQIGRICVRKPFRGQSVGTYVVKFLCNKAISLGARKAVLLAQLDKQGFYYRIGFRPDPNGEVIMDEGVPHIKMTKVLVRSKRKAKPIYPY